MRSERLQYADATAIKASLALGSLLRSKSMMNDADAKSRVTSAPMDGTEKGCPEEFELIRLLMSRQGITKTSFGGPGKPKTIPSQTSAWGKFEASLGACS